jgi:putative hydrolase of the HAD superfamily
MSDSDLCAVAFDAVGTLIHPHPPAADVYAAVGRRFGSRLGVSEIRTRFPAAFAAQEQIDRHGDLATDEPRELRRWRTIVAHVLDDVADPAACFAELHDHFARPNAWRCDADAAGLIARLVRAGYRLALASNYDGRLRAVVAGLPALAPVTTLVISSEVGWRKPAGRFFARLADSLGVPVEAVLYVGDDLANDYDGARQAGLRAVLYDPRDRHPELGTGRLRRLGDLRLPGGS